MTCTRCEGLMLEEHMIDMEGGYDEMWSRSWRCFNCRHRDDALMQQHRLAQAPEMVVNHPAVTEEEPINLSWESESVESLVV
jgi:hypothetical protein